MRAAFSGVVLLLLAPMIFAQSAPREKLRADTPRSALLGMDPARVDPTDLPLDPIDRVPATGTPQKTADISAWRLTIDGKAIAHETSFAYRELMALPLVRKNVLLICPGVFAGYVEWEGIPLQLLLEKAGAADGYKNISFLASDGYRERFSRQDVSQHFFLLAVKASGAPLPVEHGFPLRLVAEGFYGGRWTKWITRISLD